MAISLEDIPVRGPGTTPPPVNPGSVRKPGTNTPARGNGGASSASSRQARMYGRAAADLQVQIKTLKDAIFNEFKRARKQNIRDINLMLGQQLDILRQSAAERGDILLDWAADTEKATADVQEGGFRNLVRERADTMSAILEQGAGETDAVRAMLMNARNWNANASEANRTYFDTMQSVNQGITDLNLDTKNALANAHMTAEGQKEQQWQAFYDRRSEALTALGNTYGEQRNLRRQASALDAGSGGGKGKDKGKDKPLFAGGGVLPGTKTFRKEGARGAGGKMGMKKAFTMASNELGKSYVQKPLPDWIEDYEGTAQVQRRQENSNLAAAPTMENVQRAQGATLRTWAG